MVCSTRMISWQQPIKQQCLVVCRFWHWQLQSSHLQLDDFQSTPEYEWDEQWRMPTLRRGQSKEITVVHSNTRVKTQPFTERHKSYLLAGEAVLMGAWVPMGCAWAASAVPQGVPSRLQDIHPMWQLCHFCAACFFTPGHTCWHTFQNRTCGWVRKRRGRAAIQKRLPSWHAALQQGLEVFHPVCPKDK